MSSRVNDHMDRQLRSFVLIARAGSLHAAARSLGISQPALSKQMDQLEQAVGVELLRRTNKGVTLTADGDALFRKIYALFDDIDSSVMEVGSRSTSLSGSIVIGAIETFRNIGSVWDAIEFFVKNHPRVSVIINTDYSETIVKNVLSGEYDIGIIHDNVQHSSELDRHVLLRDNLNIVYLEHAFDRGAIERFPAWENGPALINFGTRSSLGRLVSHYSERYSIPIRVEVNSLSYLEEAIFRGLGVAILPQSFPIKTDSRGMLAYYSSPVLATLKSNVLIKKKRGSMSAQAQRFTGILLDHLQSHQIGHMSDSEEKHSLFPK